MDTLFDEKTSKKVLTYQTGNTYVVDLAKTAVGKHVRVVATGKTNYSGTVNSTATQIGATPVTAIAATTGTPQNGQTLTAGALTPSGATANYQWQVSVDGISGGWADILGETANTYVVDLAKSAVGKYVRVVATGNGNYASTVESDAVRIESFMDMLSVPAGTFQRDETAANTSTVSAFSMSKYEITREQFLAIMGTDPSNTEYSSGLNDPVQQANWYHAIAFCNKLSLAEGLTPAYSVSGVDFSTLIYSEIPTEGDGSWNAATCDWNANGYRLPTEMEWMWAAMGADKDDPGATNTTGYNKTFAGSTGSIDDNAWYSSNAGTQTQPAGTKNANELGLYDMSGNVWEWCWDWYGSYPVNSNSDYRGAGTGSNRLRRGGSFSNSAGNVTVASRNGYSPYNQNDDFGFRVVRP